MISRSARIAKLEAFYKPHVLSKFRFITHFQIEEGDEREGTHLDIQHQGSPIGELIIFNSTRAGYCRQREQLRRSFNLLEG